MIDVDNRPARTLIFAAPGPKPENVPVGTRVWMAPSEFNPAFIDLMRREVDDLGPRDTLVVDEFIDDWPVVNDIVTSAYQRGVRVIALVSPKNTPTIDPKTKALLSRNALRGAS